MSKWVGKAAAVLLTAGLAAGVSVFFGGTRASADGGLEEEVGSYAEVYRISEDEVIAEGVSIGGMNIGGMTLREATLAVEERQREMLNRTVTLSLEDRTAVYTMAELGLRFDSPAKDMVMAAGLGKSGPLINRYKYTKDLENNGYAYAMRHYADRNTAAGLIAKFAGEANQEAVEATITRSGDVFTVTPEQTGIAVNEAEALAQVLDAVETWDGTSDLALTVAAEVTEPKCTAEMLSGIRDLLGGFKTICGDITTGRGQNVLVGAKKMNGNVVLPGESYSVVEVLAPFSEDNGYTTAVAYLNAGYIDDIGGGVCSLSTTLYNALLRAELQIDKRWNHSMTVSYVDWGFDATVNGDGSRDLVFTNNYDTPVYIEAYVVRSSPDSWLYFNIYGRETRDMSRRSLKFYNVVLESQYPTAEEYRYVIDETLNPGEEIWDQGAYPYAKVQSYKEVYMDGQLVEKTMLSEDTYVKSPPIIRYNPGTQGQEEPAAAQPQPGDQPEAPEGGA